MLEEKLTYTKENEEKKGIKYDRDVHEKE